MFEADELQEFLWTYAGPVCKQALKMEGAQVNFFSNLIQAWLIPEIVDDIPDRFFNSSIIQALLCHVSILQSEVADLPASAKPETC